MRRLVKTLRRAGAVVGDERPKVFRVLDLTAAAGTAVTAETTAEGRLAAMLDAQVRAMLRADPAVRLGLGSEPLHDFRVATRRMRALLRAARPGLDERWAEGLRTELGWLAGETSAARDLDVLVEEFLPRVERLGEADSEGGAYVLDGLTADRAAARARGARRARQPAVLRAGRAPGRRGREPAARGARPADGARSSGASTGGCARRRAGRARSPTMRRCTASGSRASARGTRASWRRSRTTARGRRSSAPRRASRTCSAPTRTPSSPRSACVPWLPVPIRPWRSRPVGWSSRRPSAALRLEASFRRRLRALARAAKRWTLIG